MFLKTNASAHGPSLMPLCVCVLNKNRNDKQKTKTKTMMRKKESESPKFGGQNQDNIFAKTHPINKLIRVMV